MRKLILFVLLCSSILTAQSQTIISGGIFTSTTWTKSNSPYLVKGNVYVYAGVNITIEPGVVVLMDTNAEINFTTSNRFIAVGTVTDSIIFKSAYSENKGTWTEIVFASQNLFKLKYVRVSHAFQAFRVQGSTPYQIENCKFINNNIGLSLSNGRKDSLNYLRNCSFINNNVGLASHSGYETRNLLFMYNKQAANLETYGNVSDAEFYYNERAVDLFYGAAMKNSIAKWNKTGVHSDEGILSCNIIMDNEVGVDLEDLPPDSTNKVCNNSLYNFKVGTAYVNLTKVCQCSTDSAYLNSKIFDAYDEPGRGIATYYPARLCDSFTSISTLCVSGTSLPGELENSLLLYPNPMQEYAQLTLNSSLQNAEIIILDVLGKVLRRYDSVNAKEFTIERGDLSAGSYFIIIKSNDAYKSVKMLVSN